MRRAPMLALTVLPALLAGCAVYRAPPPPPRAVYVAPPPAVYRPAPPPYRPYPYPYRRYRGWGWHG